MCEVARCPTFVAVAAGGEHSLLLDSAGRVYSCGNSDNGRLGFLLPPPGTTLGPAQHGQDVTMPTELPRPPCLRVFAGEYHSALVTASEPHALWTFGCGSVGQLGHGSSTEDVPEPKCVESLASLLASQGATVADAALGDGHTVVLSSSGSCLAFGNNESGALGVLGTSLSGFSKQSERYGFGVRGPSRITPSQVAALSSICVVRVATSTRHSLFVSDSGEVYGAGENQYGQLALPGLARSTVPRKLPLKDAFPSSTRVIRVACGARHSLFLGSDGLVRGCGSNESGELGLGSDCQGTANVVTLLPMLSEIVEVVAGAAHSLFLTRTGDVYGCGWGACGALGTGMSANVTTPVKVLDAEVLGSPVVQLSCSSHHSIALTADGTVRTAGWNGHGQLGCGMVVSKQLNWMAITTVVRFNEQQREVAVAASVQRQRVLSTNAVPCEESFQPRYTGGDRSAAMTVGDESDDEAGKSQRNSEIPMVANGAAGNDTTGSPSYRCFERVCPTPQ